ncbi:MAG: hypothetical protein HZB39_21315 [Planctomycetes bacterium]|nr:hypothetical protein [Planctomycetota bacterium]
MTTGGYGWRVRRGGSRCPVEGHAAFERLDGDLRCVRFSGIRSFHDGVVRFTVALRGQGTMDFRYESSTGELVVDRLRGTDARTQLVVHRHGLHGLFDFGLADCSLDQPLGSLWSNALFGTIELRRQRGSFVLADGSMVFQAVFPRTTVVRYDGAHGALDVTPADGSLALDARREHVVGARAGELRLVAHPSAPDARVAWRQVRGPRLEMLGKRSAEASLRAGGLGAGEEAVFFVGAELPRAVAVETVVVRHR